MTVRRTQQLAMGPAAGLPDDRTEGTDCLDLRFRRGRLAHPFGKAVITQANRSIAQTGRLCYGIPSVCRYFFSSRSVCAGAGRLFPVAISAAPTSRVSAR
jgi:hypothetical protein